MYMHIYIYIYTYRPTAAATTPRSGCHRHCCHFPILLLPVCVCVSLSLSLCMNKHYPKEKGPLGRWAFKAPDQGLECRFC